MPELPDVESFRRVLASHAVDRRIERVDVTDAGVLRGIGAQRFAEALGGRRFGQPRRQGKWLIVPTDADPVMLLHFGMTGSLVWADPGEDRHRHDRIVFVQPHGELRYRDMRKLQGVRLPRDRAEAERVLADVGPDAADVSSGDRLHELLGDRRKQVKAALLDQSVIAGLGNLLADEILWRAHIHPRRSCVQLGRNDYTRLAGRMRTVLPQAVTAGRVPPRESWLTGHRDEPSGSCPRCGTTLAHGRIGGRSTVWCPHCQPDG